MIERLVRFDLQFWNLEISIKKISKCDFKKTSAPLLTKKVIWQNLRLQKNSNLKTSVDLLYHGVVLYHDVKGLHIFANVEKGGEES